MAWKGETQGFSSGISHKGICPLLKQWRKFDRQVVKGKATVESSVWLREAMVKYLRAAVSAEPGEDIQESRSAVTA